MQNKRIYSLDVIKLYLSYVIAFYHMSMTLPPSILAVVRLYFVIFGFFLGKKFYSAPVNEAGEPCTAWKYSMDHLKSMYPHLFFSITIYYLYRLSRYVLINCIQLHSAGWWQEAISDLFRLLPEYTLTVSAIHMFEGANFALWQLSAMMICGYFIYALLRRDEKTARTILLPAAILMSESLLTQASSWENYGPIYLTLARAMAPMCAGYFTWVFTTTPTWAAVRQHRHLVDAASVLAIASIFAFGDNEHFSYFNIPIVVLACWAPDSLINKLLNHRCFRWCGRFSLSIYFDHIMITRICQNLVGAPFLRWGLPLNGWQMGIIYFVLLTVYSTFTTILIEKCTAAWRARRAAGAA